MTPHSPKKGILMPHDEQFASEHAEPADGAATPTGGARRRGPSRRGVIGAAAGAVLGGGALAIAANASGSEATGRGNGEPLQVERPRAAGPLDLDNTPDAVGICYSVWHNLAVGPGRPIHDNTEILHAANSTGQPPQWGPLHAFHYWGRPERGYYRGDDAGVLRHHFRQLAEARIDFIAIDATNINGQPDADSEDSYYQPTRVLLEAMRAHRDSGEATPFVVPWVSTRADAADPAASGLATHDRFYASGEWQDLFVQYQGKPLLLTTDTLPDVLAERFTLRKMWGLQQQLAEREWSFLQEYPQNVGMDGGVPEQVAVCAALQKSYMTDPSAIARRGGRTMREQWRHAFSVRPRVTMLTWWNEWIAQRFEDEQGNARFVDAYDASLSRDIEPMDPSQPGSHGDLYYRWTRQYVAAYEDHQPFPEGLVQG
ncbi:hypothetical protein EBN88_04215 [Streptomyces triticirhizae]|uniref:Uncharacterized protein n=2 Tax=Streptomyces triticirhizae TaxID=2483353 RepID=A0A3M2M613_9ACTN|nr:hypothetical protein EBN88_04215 [Streptomyces triticirhizae]